MEVKGEKTKITLMEAARLLQELNICKAFRAENRINGPNCYRFGHKDPASNHWFFYVSELLEEARKRESAPPALIQEVVDRYSVQRFPRQFTRQAMIKTAPEQSFIPHEHSRAELEKSFGDEVRELEAAMKGIIHTEGGTADHRTLGALIYALETNNILQKLEISEAKYVNTIRNTLYHANLGDVSDNQLGRGLDSARSLTNSLRHLFEDNKRK